MHTILTFVAVAAGLNGLLAGLNVDRSIVQMPAWRRVGVSAWATYSRKADLGRGLVLYPFEAFGGAIASIAAAIGGYMMHWRGCEAAKLPVVLATALVVGGLIATVAAAPKMLGLKKCGDDVGALQRAFEGFARWGNVRSLFQVSAFAANLWTLVVLAK